MAKEHPNTIYLFKDLMLRYPKRTISVVISMIFCGFSEGAGIISLMPFLGILINPDKNHQSFIYQKLSCFFNLIGLEMNILMLLVLITFFMVLKSIFTCIASVQSGYSGIKVATDMRMRLIDALMKARFSYFLEKPVGLFSNALTIEAHGIVRTYRNLCSVMAYIIQALFYVTLAAMISWKVTLGAIFVGTIIVLMLGWLIGVARRAGKNQTEVFKTLSVRLIDGLQCMKTLKSMGREDALKPILEKETQNLNRAQKKYVLAEHGLLALQEPILVMALAFGMFLGIKVFQQEFESLMVLALLFWRMMAMVARSQSLYQRASRTESYYWSIWDTINEVELNVEKHKGIKTSTYEEKIELQDVSFSFASNLIFENTNLVIPKGSYIGLVGPSGSGKTTLADLCIGLFNTGSGHVLVDNLKMEDINIKEWRKKIGYVQQESVLFHDSVYTNVALSDGAITEDEVKDALISAGAWDFVTELPQGIHTFIGEKGGKLSGGQRQRLAIARALVRKPELLILDEATTALDPVTEAAIVKTIKNLKGKITIIAISHQKAMIDIADKIYSLEKGEAIKELRKT